MSRADQDAFALQSTAARGRRHRGRSRSTSQIVPVMVPQPKGEPVVVDRDEHPRADTSMEALGALAAGVPRGRQRDGRATARASTTARRAVLVVEAERARGTACSRMARVVSTAVAGVDPAVMGLGPIPATRKALARAGLARRRPRPGRAQRGLRQPVDRVHARARPGSRARSTSTAARSRSAIRWE